MNDRDYLLVCVAIAGSAFFVAHLIESRYKLLLWLDALGLSAYCVYGTWKGLEATGSVQVAVVMGVLTATFGGILRDRLVGGPSVLMRREIYVTAALVGAVLFAVLNSAHLLPIAAAAIAFFVAFGLRAGAIRYGWTIPAYSRGTQASAARDEHTRDEE